MAVQIQNLRFFAIRISWLIHPSHPFQNESSSVNSLKVTGTYPSSVFIFMTAAPEVRLKILAKIYEKAVQFPSGGSITIIAVTTLSGGDITHAVPDNTGYITEGQLFLRRDSDIGKVIVDPFRSLSRLKQLVSGKKTRKDHPQVMNAAVRLYADAANAKTKMENGFDLTNYDERALAFAKDYANQLLAIDVNLNTTEMLDVTWGLFSKYFKPEEVNIKKEFVDQYWKK